MLHQYEERTPSCCRPKSPGPSARIANCGAREFRGSAMRRHYAYELAKKLTRTRRFASWKRASEMLGHCRPTGGLRSSNKVFTDNPRRASEWARELSRWRLRASTSAGPFGPRISISSATPAPAILVDAGVVCRAVQ